MHCETTVDSEGTWQGSWRALERLYSEGFLMSIGVSNFNVNLLEQLEEFSAVQPQIVQNFADIEHLDLDVRNYCYEQEILYMPYAFQRNVNLLSPDTHATLQRIAENHGKSVNLVILRSFFQSHAALIPRSDNPDHIEENLKIMNWRLTDAEMISLGWPSSDDHGDL
jgi:diketogulonate reductase-like aldo/keto reductase